MTKKTKSTNVRVAILDDHQSTIDGYAYRLQGNPEIEILISAQNAEQLEEQLENTQVDVLLLDVSVPISDSDTNQIPLLHFIPKLLSNYEKLRILIISMHQQKTLIKSVMDSGARGYIVKDDRDSILNLAEIILSVAAGGFYFSKQSYQSLLGESDAKNALSMPTSRQLEVLSLCAAMPATNSQDIAKTLNIAPSTLRNLLTECYKRLGVHNRASAVEKARKMGLIAPPSS